MAKTFLGQFDKVTCSVPGGEWGIELVSPGETPKVWSRAKSIVIVLQALGIDVIPFIHSLTYFLIHLFVQ